MWYKEDLEEIFKQYSQVITIKPHMTKVLLCSPLGEKGAGGIAKWTRFILNYYQNSNKAVNLEHYYPAVKPNYNNTPLYIRLWRGISYYSGFLKGLNSQLQSKPVDVVHLCSSASISLMKDLGVVKIAHKRGAKAIVHFRFGRIPEVYKSKNWEFRLIDKVVRAADKVIVIDQMSYDTLVEFGYKNILILPNPLSVDVIGLISQHKDVERIPRKIVFAGHVVPTKGVVELIQACKTIKNIKLEMLGFVSDEMRQQLYAEAGENSSQWLDIKGEQTSSEVIMAMKSSNLFVLPTYTEGFPNVIIESMACGCTIVSTPVGAIPEMLNITGEDKCGVCLPVKDVTNLSATIEMLLDDNVTAEKYAANAVARVNKMYSMDVVWQQLVQIWKNN